MMRLVIYLVVNFMHPSKLQFGDLIFFHSPIGPEHVAMYTGEIDGRPHITHTVTDDNPGLKSTVLKKSGLFEFYTVFRPTNTNLGQLAAKQILDWTKYHIPYDQRRAKWMHRINKVIWQSCERSNRDPKAALIAYLEKQAQKKIFERIKFASRRDTCPVKIKSDAESRGFTCVQAVILAYQVSELLPYVKTLQEVQQTFFELLDPKDEEDKEVWISDKHCPNDILDKYYLPVSYVDYNLGLRDKEEFEDFYLDDKGETPSQPYYLPSLVAWRYDIEPSIDEFNNKFKSCLNLPAKICYTDGLEAYLQAHPESWINLGRLEHNVLPSEFSEDEKILHRSRSSSQLLFVNSNRSEAQRERSISPRLGSSSPRTVGPFFINNNEDTTLVNNSSEEVKSSPLDSLLSKCLIKN